MPAEMDINVNFKGLGLGVGGGASGGKKGGINGALLSGVAGGGVAAAIMTGIDILKKIFGALVDNSGALQAVKKMFSATVTLILRPIGDLLARLLKPLALALIPMAVGFSKWMYGGGLLRLETFFKGLGEILLGIGKILTMGFGGLLMAFGLTTANPIMAGAGMLILSLLGDPIEYLKGAINDFWAGVLRLGAAVSGSIDTLNVISNFNSTELVEVWNATRTNFSAFNDAISAVKDQFNVEGSALTATVKTIADMTNKNGLTFSDNMEELSKIISDYGGASGKIPLNLDNFVTQINNYGGKGGVIPSALNEFVKNLKKYGYAEEGSVSYALINIAKSINNARDEIDRKKREIESWKPPESRIIIDTPTVDTPTSLPKGTYVPGSKIYGYSEWK